MAYIVLRNFRDSFVRLVGLVSRFSEGETGVGEFERRSVFMV